jgi:hypothetical protein
VLRLRAGFFDGRFKSYEEVATAYDRAKMAKEGPAAKTTLSAAGLGDSVRLSEYEVRFADKADVARIYQLSAEFFPPEVLFNEEAVAGWVDRGHYRVVVEKELSSGVSTVAGYYGVWSLPKRSYDWIRDHLGQERVLKPQMGCRLDSQELYALYILDLLGPRDDPFVKSLLCTDLALYISVLCDRHRRIERVGAWAYSEEGRNLCSKLGLKPSKSEFYEVEGERIRTGDLTNTAQSVMRRRFFLETYCVP